MYTMLHIKDTSVELEKTGLQKLSTIELIVCDYDCGLRFILQWHIAFIPLLKQQNIKIGLLSLFYFLILP